MTRWWHDNAADGDASVGPIDVHPAADGVNAAHRAEGVALPALRDWAELEDPRRLRGTLIVAPPSGASPWRLQRDVRVRESFASGWMQRHKARHRAGLDRGFVLSDHADWAGLLAAVRATRCARVIVTHGDEAVLARAFAEMGLASGTFRTAFGGDAEG